MPSRAPIPPWNVLYVSYDGVLEPIGQSQVLPYLEGLGRDGASFALLTFEKPADLVPDSPARAATRARLDAVGIDWVRLRYTKRPPVLSTAYDVLRGALWTCWLARRHGADLVHVRSYVPAVMALPTRWLLRRPLVFDIRGFWVDERVDGGIWRRGRLYWVAKRVERLLYRHADAVVSLTEAGARVIEGFPGIARRRVPVAVIPTCVDTERFAPREPDPALAAHPALAGKTVFASVGSVGTWAATEETLEFFRVASGELPKTALLLLARGPVEPLRRAVEARGLVAATTIVPSVPHEAVPRWLSVSAVGLALYRPGWSNVARAPTKVGEYLASGLPVVVSAGVGDCEALLAGERVGVTVRDLTAEAYRRAARELATLLADPGLAARCRAVAVRELSVAEGVERYRAVYRRLAAGPAS